MLRVSCTSLKNLHIHIIVCIYIRASLVAQTVKSPPAMRETWVRSLSWEDPLEKGMATGNSILAWRIPRTVQSMRLQRVRHDWATFSFFLHLWDWETVSFYNPCFLSAPQHKTRHDPCKALLSQKWGGSRKDVKGRQEIPFTLKNVLWLWNIRRMSRKNQAIVYTFSVSLSLTRSNHMASLKGSP